MSALQANPFLLAGGGEDGYEIERSLRFNSGDTAYIDRTCGNPTASGTWTLSCWVKRNKLGGDMTLFSARSGGNPVQIYFSTDKLRFYDDGRDMYTDAVFRDTSAWYHIVVTRTTTVNSIYVNGLLSKSTTYSSSSSSNANTNGASQAFGMLYFVGSSIGYYGDMYLADPHFIDGQALAPTDFGETDDNGVWQPIKYEGTYGTNGFHLDFADNSSASALGNDAAGSNNWTVNNLSVAAGSGNDSLVDSPSQIADQTDTGAGGEIVGNYCTWNSLGSSTYTLTNGNLDASFVNNTSNVLYGTIGVTSGKWYWEVTVLNNTYPMIGIVDLGVKEGFMNYGAAGGLYMYQRTGGLYGQMGGSFSNTAYAAQSAVNDVIGVALDMDNGNVTFYKNGTSLGVANTSTLAGKTIAPGFGNPGVATATSTNFGARSFAYTAPSGYKTLNTANLPEPTIEDPSEYFDTHLYTGNSSSTQALTLPFEPGMMWHKMRSSGSSHYIHDVIRGFANNKAVCPNKTNAEGFNSAYYSLSLSGTTVTVGNNGPGNEWNTNNSTFVNWLWNGGSSTVTNTAGSITSQVRANPTAGFSIVTYTSPNNSNNQSFGHGLNAKPGFVLVKNRDSSYNWDIYHSSLGYNSSLIFTTANTRSGAFSSEPTSTVVNTRNDYTHVGSNKYVAYCFAPVEGYSAMGSYHGNGLINGPFVYTGFKPAFVLTKVTSRSGTWLIWDTKRGPYNETKNTLSAESSASESTAYYALDILSNGFKIRNSYTAVNSTHTYIYLAFAENPFKTARAR